MARAQIISFGTSITKWLENSKRVDFQAWSQYTMLGWNLCVYNVRLVHPQTLHAQLASNNRIKEENCHTYILTTSWNLDAAASKSGCASSLDTTASKASEHSSIPNSWKSTCPSGSMPAEQIWFSLVTCKSIPSCKSNKRPWHVLQSGRGASISKRTKQPKRKRRETIQRTVGRLIFRAWTGFPIAVAWVNLSLMTTLWRIVQIPQRKV